MDSKNDLHFRPMIWLNLHKNSIRFKLQIEAGEKNWMPNIVCIKRVLYGDY